ncbi:putative Late embryogenesis abundant protein, LEA_3 subgroup [Helianthus annuus]|nr:putative Late embryogenesis abundant protein, LEA_3 subgroup [Helianthus annuus]
MICVLARIGFDDYVLIICNYRRGLATVTKGSVYGSVRGSGVAMIKKATSEKSKKSSSWVPDPVTGYYKPEGQINPVDAAELRELPLKQKNLRN